MPDSFYHSINDNTYTLQYYLNNTNKYFTSNTQLHFLPGQYYLNNDLIIQGVSNFSLIGNRTNEVINTVINCTSPAGIVVVNSSNIVIANIVMNDCGNDYTAISNDHLFEKHIKFTSLLFFQSRLTICTYLHLNKGTGGMMLINPLVKAKLSEITVNYMVLRYDEYTDNTNHTFYINNIQFHENNVDIYSIQIEQFNMSSNISVIIQHVNFVCTQALQIVCINCTGHSSTTIRDCNFKVLKNSSSYSYYYYNDNFKDSKDSFYDNEFNSSLLAYYQDCGNVNMVNKLHFINCQFANNTESNALVTIIQNNILKRTLKKNNILKNLKIIIVSCIFHNNKYVQILSVYCLFSNSDQQYCITLLIKNTTISFNTHFEWPLVYFYQIKAVIDQIKVTSNNGLFEADTSNIFTGEDSYLQFNGYNEISNNTVNVAITQLLVHLQEDTVINFIFNTVKYAIKPKIHMMFMDACPIQYFSKKRNLDEEFQRGDKLNYSIIFNNNNMSAISNNDIMHCRWDSYSAFSISRPALVNRKFIAYNHSVGEHRFICLCYDNKTNCHDEDFGPYYPGQTIQLDFLLVESGTKVVLVNEISIFDVSCKHDKSKEIVFELQYEICKRIEYKIMYHYREWCEFSLRTFITQIMQTQRLHTMENEAYTILLQPCPKGFSLHSEEYCQCDPILSSYIPSLTHCNIDDQTIPRPANSWISAHTVNNSHSYHVSLHCPFDYCLPYSSHLNLSTPDSQCQFHRSGLLCGQCQQGLSAVFASSQCKHCSNVYLLIIIPIAIAGLVLVLLLFVLNLTVTDGNINPILLSVNIISINISIIFPITNNSVMHTFISLANLDLGIETCFYDGMDEYTKRWLQLVFPAYLICIAMVIIIASRYSIRIQRLTARRALPVLATLFLLSYTKVLLTVSNVLFFYSSIIYLPSSLTAIVWSVDSSIPLSGFKFIILFITCLLLFLVLIPFNIALIFTKILPNFRVVNYFKPLLDAYQGPYKIKFYYWTGLQLVIRAIFFGLSALDRDINLMLSIILLGVIICLHKVFPFNKKINNVSEMLSLLNLQAIFVIVYFMNTNDIMINFAVSLVMFQLMCIVLLHVRMPFCSGNNFTELNLSNFGKWLATLIWKKRKPNKAY